MALGLANAGARVFATGRSIKQADFGAVVSTLTCDHTDDEAVTGVFQYIDEHAGHLNILANVAWGGYERMAEDGRFTWSAPFWEQPMWRWEAMVTTGVRAAFVASQQVVSLYPGLVRTEAVVAAGVFDLSNSESPEFIGRAVAALAGDLSVSRWSGQVVTAAALGTEYGFTDVDGRQPRPLAWNAS